MRVPTYNRQTARTAQTGARNFSVRANPGALAQGQSALADTARAAETAALQWYETETKERRLNELTEAENQFKIQAQNRKLQSLDQNPQTVIFGRDSKGTGSWQQTATSDMMRIANDITDKKVRSSFLSSAQQIMLAERASVFQNARVKAIDIAKANELEAAERLISEAVQGNLAQRTIANLKLFGGVAAPGEAATVGIYDQMADRGLINREEAFKLNRSGKQRIAKSDFRSRLAAADRSGDPLQAAQLVADVNDTKNFSNMKPEDRDTAFSQAVDLEQQLQKRSIQLAENQERKDSKNRTDRHSKNAQDIVSRIIAANASPDDRDTVANRPTSLEIATLLSTDQISDTFARTAENLINDVDADRRDPDLIAGIFSDISTASTDDDIDAAVNRIQPNMGLNGTIPLNDALSLMRFADGKRAKTTDTTDIEFYRKQLDDITGATAYRIGGVGIGEAEVFRQIDAADTYRRLTLDPVNPVKPREAYQQIIEQFFRARKDRIDFLAPSALLDNYFGGKKPNDWTRQDVAGAKTAIVANENLTQLEKTIEFETLDEITKLIESRPPISPPGDSQQGDPSWSNWIRNWWGNNNSLSDREQSLRNPG